MTPDTIAEARKSFLDAIPKCNGMPAMYGLAASSMVSAAWEVAAQLAEQNALLREDQQFRKTIAEEQRSESRKRDELLAASAQGIDAFRKSVEQPPSLLKVFAGPQDMPRHLGCFVLMPDGTHGIAVEGSIIPLQPDDAARILAVITAPPEGKPQ